MSIEFRHWEGILLNEGGEATAQLPREMGAPSLEVLKAMDGALGRLSWCRGNCAMASTEAPTMKRLPSSRQCPAYKQLQGCAQNQAVLQGWNKLLIKRC